MPLTVRLPLITVFCTVSVLAVKLPLDTILFDTKLPETLKLVSVPTLVMFGCAFVYTVPATNALPTCPETLAPATAFAVVANATAPLTLAP